MMVTMRVCLPARLPARLLLTHSRCSEPASKKQKHNSGAAQSVDPDDTRDDYQRDRDSRTIFCGNLSWNCDEDMLYEALEEFGTVSYVARALSLGFSCACVALLRWAVCVFLRAEMCALCMIRRPASIADLDMWSLRAQIP